MKKGVSISSKAFDKTSLNFSELFEEGMESLQILSGENWTDYNAHDPGVTILEQLCYAITDAAYRSSLPINDLLKRRTDRDIEDNANAFYSPNEILCSHPFTTYDYRKILIDRIPEIQNLWLDQEGTEISIAEKLNGLNVVEILPDLQLQTIVKQKSRADRKDFAPKVRLFLEKIRNIGEDFENVSVLKRQDIAIHLEVHLYRLRDVNNTIANLFLRLFEFIHCPVRHFSLEEMLEEGLSMDQVFDGPRLERGFIKQEDLGTKKEVLSADELQHVLLQVEGIKKCKISSIQDLDENSEGSQSKTDSDTLILKKGHFFNLSTDSKLRNIYENLKVYVNEQEFDLLERDAINKLVYEAWSKKFRQYELGDSQIEHFEKGLKGKFLNPGAYYSIQNHFPMIYGIGKEGLTANDPVERHAKAKQLKAYLLFFEQPLANYLAQLQNLSEYFNITYNSNSQKQTYFSQYIKTIPNVAHQDEPKAEVSDPLAVLNKFLAYDIFRDPVPDSLTESEESFYSRKNKIYDHLLARFGEELEELPWRVSRNLNLLEIGRDYRDELLIQKSQFLRKLNALKGVKGESFYNPKYNSSSDAAVDRFFNSYSGLEQILYLKTGIPERKTIEKSLVPELKDIELQKLPDEIKLGQAEFHEAYDPIHSEDLIPVDVDLEQGPLPRIYLGQISYKALLGRSMNIGNYMISKNKDENSSTRVIFQKAPSRWVNLFSSDSEKEAKYQVSRYIDYFKELNLASEGFYIVDHILLRDMLHETECGFTFYDEKGNAVIQTRRTETWFKNKGDRSKRIKELFSLVFAEGFIETLEDEESGSLRILSRNSDELGELVFQDNQWQLMVPKSKEKIDELILEQEEELKDLRGEDLDKRMDEITSPILLGSYRLEGSNWQLLNFENQPIATIICDEEITIVKAYEQLRYLVRLFDTSSTNFGEFKLKEVENYRRLGNLQGDIGDYRPSKLVFQRKLDLESDLNYQQTNSAFRAQRTFDKNTQNGYHLIDEGFFDMKISVVIPDWPARFQDKRFNDFLEQLIYERTPAHIAVDILRINVEQMKLFEAHYHEWEKAKVQLDPANKSTDALRQKSFRVYDILQMAKADQEV